MVAKQYAPSTSVWPAWAQPAFAYTNTHSVAKGTPAFRGVGAVATYLSVANALPWATALAYGLMAYGQAMAAHVANGGKPATYKQAAGCTTAAQWAAAAAKQAWACTLPIANGMLGTVANATKGTTAPLAFAPLASTTAPVAYAKGNAAVAYAYNGVPAHQHSAPTNPTLTKVALPALPTPTK